MEASKKWGPKWIRKLVRESWQAELVISGAAIIGSLQLPDLLEWCQHYLLVHFDQPMLNLWFLATAYWALFVYGLIILFIYHFIIRALWIGLLGLKSKYPNGIARTTLTSEDFYEKTIAEYGRIDEFITRLDKTASGLFGAGFAIAGVLFNFGLLLSVAIIALSFLREWGLPTGVASAIVLAPLALSLVLSLASATLSAEQFRDREWVKRYHFPAVKTLNRVMYPVNHRFISMGLNMITSNAAAQKYSKQKIKPQELIFALLTMVGVGMAIGVAAAVTDVMKPQFLAGFYWRMGNDPTGMDPKNYADSDYDGLLYEPQLSNRYVRAGDPFWVWVPLPEREYEPMLESCTIAEVDDDDLSRSETRLANWKRTIACARQYIELHLDTARQALPLPEPLRHYRTTTGIEQFGIYLDLSDQVPDLGRHTLRVVTHFERDAGDGLYRSTYIPFFVTTGDHD